MKKIIIFRNIILLVVLTMFGTIIFSLINNANPTEPEEYHHQDTRSNQEKIAEGNYFTDEGGNIVNLTNEEAELFDAKISQSEFVIGKSNEELGHIRLVQEVLFTDGYPTGHGDSKFYSSHVEDGSWTPEQVTNAKYDDTSYEEDGQAGYWEEDWYTSNKRNDGTYYARSSIDMQGVEGLSNYTYQSPSYAFIGNDTVNEAVISNQEITTTDAKYTSWNPEAGHIGSINYSADILDIDDKYREFGISIDNGPIEVLDSSEVSRTPRDDVDAWMSQDDTTGQKVSFSINYNTGNVLEGGEHIVQLYGQEHDYKKSEGWNKIGPEETTKVWYENNAPVELALLIDGENNPNSPPPSLIRPNEGASNGSVELLGSWDLSVPNNVTKVEVIYGGTAVNETGTPITVEIPADQIEKELDEEYSVARYSFKHTIENLKDGELEYQLLLHYDGKDEKLKKSEKRDFLISEREPPSHFDLVYLDDGTCPNTGIPYYIPASEGEANGEIILSGAYLEHTSPAPTVNKIEVQMSFDNEQTWTELKPVDSTDFNQGLFFTRLTGIPAGNFTTRFKLTYDSNDLTTSEDDNFVYEKAAPYKMGESKNPLLESPDTSLVLTPTVDTSEIDESIINVSGSIMDIDNQIEQIDLLYSPSEGKNNWEKIEDIDFTTSNGKQTFDHTVTGLKYDTEYNFTIEVTLKRTGNTIQRKTIEKTITSTEHSTEVVPTIEQINAIAPSRAGRNDGKVTIGIDVPSVLAGGDEIGDVTVKLKNENDLSYEIVNDPESFLPGQTTEVVFQGTDSTPIISRDGYYIEISYEWTDSEKRVHQITRYSSDTNTENINEKKTVMVPYVQEFKPQLLIDNDSIEYTVPSEWGQPDGEISFNFSTINEDNADFKEATFILYDSLGLEVSGARIDISNPNQGKQTFTDLRQGTYTIKAYMSYEINANNGFTDDHVNAKEEFVMESDPIQIENGAESKPEIIMSNDDINTITPSYQDAVDGKVNFEFDVVNDHNANIINYEVKLFDQSTSTKRELETITYNNPPVGTITGQFTGLDAGMYSIRVESTYEINDITKTSENLFTSETFEIEQGEEQPPTANIKNITKQQTSQINGNDGYIGFDYRIDNLYGTDIREVRVGIQNSKDEVVETKVWNDQGQDGIEGNVSDVVNKENSITFSNLSKDQYTIKIECDYLTNGKFVKGIVLTEKKVEIKDPNSQDVSAINQVTFDQEENNFNVFLKVYDNQNLLVEDSLDITVKINGKEEKILINQEIGEHNISIDYEIKDIFNWEIIIEADVKGTDEKWNGGTDWEYGPTTYRNEPTNMTGVIIISSVIGVLLIGTFTIVSVKLFKD